MGTTRATHCFWMDIAAKNYVGEQNTLPTIDACIASGANTPVSGVHPIEAQYSRCIGFFQISGLRLLMYNHIPEMQRHSLSSRRKRLLLLPECIDD